MINALTKTNFMSKISNVESYTDCSRMCKKNASCTHWTWVGPHYHLNRLERLDCKLKEGPMDIEGEFGLISGSAYCDPGGNLLKALRFEKDF
jgi:hypothetical protein